MSNGNFLKNSFFVLGIFLFAFILGPIRQQHGLELIPGDFGDARLNNYFLENIYQFFLGNSPSLIHLNFFSFFPFVGGFSDNLFGAAPIYLFFRGLTGQSDTAYQLWIYGSYIANYFSAYWALRLLGIKPVAAIFGALIFAFSLPVFAKTLHAQLGYRFCVPLVIAYFYLFLESGNIRFFIYSVAWLVWGFYCSIYIGVFTAFFIALMALIFLAIYLYKKKPIFSVYIAEWKKLPTSARFKYGLYLLILLAAMLVLMYPYVEVTLLYGFKRNYLEISTMLPTIKSYFLADLSPIWGFYSGLFGDVSMRHEQQMFVGVFPLGLVIFSFFIPKGERQIAYWTIGSALLLAVLLTLKVGTHYSLWEFISKLPLLNSLRAVSRIILVLLFPIAFICSLSIQYLIDKKSIVANFLVFIMLIVVVSESISSNIYVAFPKEEWRSRLRAQERRLPKDLPPDAILFFSQISSAPHIDELDAMWVSMANSKPTLNGYSGNFPSGYQFNFGSSCLEVSRRVLAYLTFTKQLDERRYSEFMRRVVPIGFDGCQFSRFNGDPQISTSNKPYSAEAFKNLNVLFKGSESISTGWRVNVDIENNGDVLISANSSTGNPISLSYRFLDQAGKPMSNWDPRIPLWVDIPAHGIEYLEFDIPKSTPAFVFIELSLVQEGIFWGYDIGKAPKRVLLNNTRGGNFGH
jgi:hypothetical protein